MRRPTHTTVRARLDSRQVTSKAMMVCDSSVRPIRPGTQLCRPRIAFSSPSSASAGGALAHQVNSATAPAMRFVISSSSLASLELAPERASENALTDASSMR